MIRSHALCMAAVLAAGAAPAAAIQPLDTIRDAALAYLAADVREPEARVQIEVGRLDPRLRLAACDQPLAAFHPPGARRHGNLSVGVRCEGAKPWTVYVTAQVKLFRKVVVLTRAVPRGSEIDPGHMRLELRDTGRLLGGYFTDPSDLRGMRAVQALPAGRVLAPNALSVPQLVRRGQRVTLLARIGGIEVRSAGNALLDGAAGDVVQVKNLRSKRVVEGIVAGEGLIRVAM